MTFEVVAAAFRAEYVVVPHRSAREHPDPQLVLVRLPGAQRAREPDDELRPGLRHVLDLDEIAAADHLQVEREPRLVPVNGQVKGDGEVGEPVGVGHDEAGFHRLGVLAVKEEHGAEAVDVPPAGIGEQRRPAALPG